MRVNIYAEELPDERLGNPDWGTRVERIEKPIPERNRTYYGIRIFLKSASELHDEPGDDDRSAVTFWGPRAKVAALLREAADAMEAKQP